MSNKARKERKRQRNALSSYTPNPRPGVGSQAFRMHRRITQEDLDKGHLNMDYFDEEGRPCPAFALTDPAAAELADLHGMQQDLWAAMAIFEQIEQIGVQYDSANADEQNLITSMIRALTDAGVIAYGRCFTSGRPAFGGGSRHEIPSEIIEGLSPEQKELHDHTVNLRNKSVAHRVDDNFQARVLVILQPVETPGVRMVGTLGASFPAGPDSARKLHSLAKHLHDALDRYTISMRQDIEVGLSALSPRALYAMADVELAE